MKTAFKLNDIRSIRPLVRRALRYVKSGSALDLGSGVGRHSLFLAQKGFRVIAVDLRSENLAALKELARLQKLPVTVYKGDVVSYIPPKKVDVIISTMVLHFLPYQAQKQTLRMMQKYTKQNGINVVSSYGDKNKKGIRPNLVRARALKKQYVDAGWDILHFEERLSQPMPASAGSGKLVRYWVVELIAEKSV